MPDPVPTHMPDPGSRPSAIELAPGISLPAGALTFRAVRSPGPGGQNVNKRSTKIELRVPVAALPLTPAALERLRRLAGWRINTDDELIITADEDRAQGRNREMAIERLSQLVRQALVTPKKRVATKPTKGSRQRRLEGKRRTSEKKSRRRSDHDDH
ncbi:MAG TPA: alternative ribosome rescue aminoacyl-tRNA hydrolase ArfB [Phycisphaerales bacterium]|nr:alternative ribosome rescue aminoacyl-tRNA hydrolase ArfB [Phycisphaerales bacterium]